LQRLQCPAKCQMHLLRPRLQSLPTNAMHTSTSRQWDTTTQKGTRNESEKPTHLIKEWLRYTVIVAMHLLSRPGIRPCGCRNTELRPISNQVQLQSQMREN
jgi:hypothetical protein